MGDEGHIVITLTGDEDRRDLAAMLGRGRDAEISEAEILDVKIRASTKPDTLIQLSDLAQENGLTLRFHQLGE